MLKSELIKALQHSIETRGDDEVFVWDANNACKIPYPQSTIALTHHTVHSELFECIIEY